MKNHKATKTHIIGLVLIVLLIISNAITLKLYLDTFVENVSQDQYDDEINRVNYFIQDWYDELTSSHGVAKVYRNEIRFENGQYTLTVAKDRIRAVYPRGIRFFQLKYITYIEFLEDENGLNCKLYYGETETTTFKLN